MIIRYVGLLDVFLFFDDVICFWSKVSDSLNLNTAAAMKTDIHARQVRTNLRGVKGVGSCIHPI